LPVCSREAIRRRFGRADARRIFLLLRLQFIAEDRDGIERFRLTDHIGREDRGDGR
jgi:hypothetical protein